MHHYQPDMGQLRDFLRRLAKGEIDRLRGIDVISKNRRRLLPYGAIVLQEIIRSLRLGSVIFSGSGVREGYLYAALPQQIQFQDPLLVAAQAMSILHARSAEHAHELAAWSAAAFAVLGMRESIDHHGRCFAALTLFYRNEGLVDEAHAPPFIKLLDVKSRHRARVLAAVMRISNLFCASSAGILPHLHWSKKGQEIILETPTRYQELIAERPQGRLQQLAKLTGQTMRFEVIE